MRLYFIRHGQSTNNLLYATTGSNNGRDCDPELTEVGYQQAKLLSEHLESVSYNITHLYSSLMVRSVSTGAIVADRLGLQLIAWPDLHEEGGIYLSDGQGNRIGQPGKDRLYFETNYPNFILPETINSSGWWNRPFEEEEERPVRANRFIQDLLTRHGDTDDRVAVISHGGFYNQVINALLNIPATQKVWFSLNNTAVTRIEFKSNPDIIEIVYHNRTNFLPQDMVT